MDYNQALLYLNKFIDYEKSCYYRYGRAYGLGNIRRLLSLLGNPHKRYMTVIISGTKGKGSTAAILTAILDMAGIKTARFTSPHLVSVRERIHIGRRPISAPELAGAVALVKKAIERGSLEGLTYFEVLTASAFAFFADKGVDIAVLEVGLGGRLDATNTAPAAVSAITPISLDHTHILGDSVREIAREKSAIIKEGSFVVCAPQHRSARAVIASTAAGKNARLLLAGRDIRYKVLNRSLSGTTFDIITPFSSYRKIKTSLVGSHQAVNASIALTTADILNKYLNFNIRKPDIKKALRHIDFPGRFQIISRRPYLVLDGAQNKASAQTLKDTLKSLFPCSDMVLVLGVSSDKDIEGIGGLLCPMASEVIFTAADSVRALPAPELAQRLDRFCKDSYVAYDIEDALAFARGLAKKRDVVVVTGSLFLVGDVLRAKRVFG